MNPIILKNETEEGIPLQVTYLPEKGMNMVSYKRGDIEVIDQATKPQFEEHFAGLGALIGPHFHHRKVLPKLDYEAHFPRLAKLPDPFSHGVGRYATWKTEATDTSVKATLKGADEWQGISLKEIEGQDFIMHFDAELKSDGLHLDLSVTSDSDSIVGIHYYYRLPNGKGTMRAPVQNSYIINREKKPLPKEWDYNDQHQLTYPFTQETDFTFHPFPNPLEGHILLDTEEYQLTTRYSCASQENAFQVYHPNGATFACMEPVSAQDPRAANLSVSALKIHLQINVPHSV